MTTTAAPPAPAPAYQSDRAFLGHPRGLGYLAFAEGWERFSYYGMTALLALYSAQFLFKPGHIEKIWGFGPFRALLEAIFGPLSPVALGGAIAARVARHVPSHVRRLTLLAPVGLDRAIDVDFVRSIVRARSGGALQHLLRRLAVRPAVLTQAQLDALAAELARGRLIELADSLVDDNGQQIDITADLRALTMPVRIIWGVQDRVIPWTQVAQAGSRCAIHLIQDAGHVPHWDQPMEVARLLE